MYTWVPGFLNVIVFITFLVELGQKMNRIHFVRTMNCKFGINLRHTRWPLSLAAAETNIYESKLTKIECFSMLRLVKFLHMPFSVIFSWHRVDARLFLIIDLVRLSGLLLCFSIGSCMGFLWSEIGETLQTQASCHPWKGSAQGNWTGWVGISNEGYGWWISGLH